MPKSQPYSEYDAIVEMGHLDYQRFKEGNPWVPTVESLASDEEARVKARRELAEMRKDKTELEAQEELVTA